jgi:ribonuclease HI
MTTPPVGEPYLLFVEASHSFPAPGDAQGVWRFVLERMSDGLRLAASDFENEDRLERLELLAVVRGLEALDEPARVTLVTKSRYVSRGLRYGLAEWRAADWQWERFGQMTPIRDHDLWRRIDGALEFHELECRLWRFGEGAREHAAPSFAPRRRPGRLAAAKEQWRRVSTAAANLGNVFQPTGLAAG